MSSPSLQVTKQRPDSFLERKGTKKHQGWAPIALKAVSIFSLTFDGDQLRGHRFSRTDSRAIGREAGPGHGCNAYLATVVIKSVGFGARLSGLESWLCHLLAGNLGKLFHPCFSFAIREMGWNRD